MILGFSHLTHTTADADKAVAAWESRGWTRSWQASNVESAPAKWPLMGRRAELHDLHFLEGPVRTEIIRHDTGAVPAASRIDISDDGRTIELLARDPAREDAFFRTALRFAPREDGSLAFTGRVPGWSVTIRNLADAQAPIDPPLDLEGLSCLAFLSTAPEADAQAMVPLGGRDVTEAFRLEINGRRLRVLMLRSPEGTLIELIKIETGP